MTRSRHDEADYDHDFDVEDSAADFQPKPPGRYEPIREHGRGGIGRVIEAFDCELNRHVALKELHHVTARSEARFTREALITARLEHPSIVPLHEAGRWPDGTPYYTMKLVAGRSLKELISTKNTLRERLGLLPNVLAIAEAVSYAHSQDVIHRDLKPSNVIIGDHGETIVIDWGLAKDLNDPSHEDLPADGPYRMAPSNELTVEGSIIGTPAYMPPEQAEGRPVDRAADVYSIGAILYHVLTGRMPFEGKTPQDTLTKALVSAPPDAAEHEPALPVELRALLRKAMARNPRERYTAAELAADLRRYQTGQLVTAHEYSRRQLLRRWYDAHRLPVIVGVVSAVVLIAFALFSLRRIVGEKDIAERERAKAEAALRDSRTRANAYLLLQAESALDVDPTAALAWVREYPAAGSQPHRAASIAAEAYARGVARHVFQGHQNLITAVATNAPGTVAASQDLAGNIWLWDLEHGSGRVLASGLPNGFSLSLLFHPARDLFAVGTGSGDIHVFDTNGDTVRILRGHTADIHRMAYSSDGTWLYSSSTDGTVRRWNVDSGESLQLKGLGPLIMPSPRGGLVAACDPNGGELKLWHAIDGHTSVLGRCRVDRAMGRALAFSADGSLLAAPNVDRDIVLYDIASGGHELLAHSRATISDLAFSADGSRVAAAYVSGEVSAWDARSGERIFHELHGPAPYEVRFLADGRLVSAGEDGLIRIIDLETGIRRTLRGHGGTVWSIAVTLDGRSLISGGRHGDVRVWSVERAHQPLRIQSPDPIYHLAWSPDGASIAADARSKTGHIWHLTTRVHTALRGHEDAVYSLAYSPDGRHLATGDAKGPLREWDLTKTTDRVVTRHRGMINAIAYSPDGRLLASGGQSGVLRVSNRLTGQSVAHDDHTKPIQTLAFSHDGQWIATGGADGHLVVRNLESGLVQALPGHQDRVHTLIFSPDDASLLSAGWDGTIRRWNLATSDGVTLVQNQTAIRDMASNPAGDRLCFVDNDGAVRLLELAGREIIDLGAHVGRSGICRFNHDAAQLATVGEDGSVRAWNLDTRATVSLRGHENTLRSVAFAPRDDRLASAASDGTIVVWSPDWSRATPLRADQLPAWIATTTSSHISHDTQLTSCELSDLSCAALAPTPTGANP